MKQEKICAYCGVSIFRYKNKTNTYFCCIPCKAKWQVLQREKLGFTKDWLIKEYITNKKSADQIAREIKRDPKRVWEWIVNYGIETRPRGTDYGQSFKPGCISAFKGHTHTEQFKQQKRQERINDGRVPYLINGIHWLKATGKKSPAWRGGITPERQKLYSTDEWKNIRFQVLNRDKKICQKCGIHYTKGVSLHIHHVVSFMILDKRLDIDNLITLCDTCHRWVHSNMNTTKDFIMEVL